MSDSVSAFFGHNNHSELERLKMEEKVNPQSVEHLYPMIDEEFKSILKSQYELFSKKMLSYGMGNISMGTNLETPEDLNLSLTAIWIRMNDKMNRLKNLVLLGNKNPLDNEPTIDAWIDIVNYSIIAQIVSKGKWRK